MEGRAVKLKNWIINFLLVGASTALALVVAYCVLSKTGYMRKWMLKSPGIQQAEPLAYSYDLRNGFRLNPNMQIHRAQPGMFDVKVRTNSEGFIDREHPLLASTYRVAYVGDSYVEAQQVPESGRFSEMTEEMVYGISKGEKMVEVMNFGISSHGTVHEYGTIKHWVLKYKPDEVWLFFFSGNDLGDNNPVLTGPPLGPNFVYSDKNETKLSDITFGFTLPPPAMWANLKKKYGELYNSFSNFWLEVMPYFYSHQQNPMMDLSLKITAQTLDLIQRTLNKEGIRFKLIYIPVPLEADPLLWREFTEKVHQKFPHLKLDWNLGEAKIRDMAESLHIGFYSLRPLVLKETTDKMYSDHFTLYGHSRVGIELAQIMLKSL